MGLRSCPGTTRCCCSPGSSRRRWRPGNTVVAKPSELTPVSTLMLAECFADLPRGRGQPGGGRGRRGRRAGRGRAHRRRGLHRARWRPARRSRPRAPQRVARMNLEMGGKDPFIVCADVAADVGGGRARRRLGRLPERRPGVHVGRALLRGARGVRRLPGRVRGARARAARRATRSTPRRTWGRWCRRRSGRRSRRRSRPPWRPAPSSSWAATAPATSAGTSSRPAVVTGAPAETDLLREETFGPVAPIVPVASLDEAIELANSTPFGLGANVYTRDLETAVRCLREIRAGTVWINDPLTDNDAGPVRRLQAVGLRARARPGGPGGLPGDQARAHRDEDRARRSGGTPTRRAPRAGARPASTSRHSPSRRPWRRCRPTSRQPQRAHQRGAGLVLGEELADQLPVAELAGRSPRAPRAAPARGRARARARST